MNTPELGLNSIHIWHFAFTPNQGISDHDVNLLDEREQHRAKKLKNSDAQHRFVWIHSRVRQMLAGYLGISATKLALSLTDLGKPILRPGIYDQDLRFNLSHSGDEAVLAVALGRDLGIDLEQLKTERSFLSIARRYFSESCIAEISALEAMSQKTAFLRAWTQYEAYKKAQGIGLRGGDKKLTFSLQQHPANRFRTLFSDQPQSEWQVASLRLPNELVGALVTTNSDRNLYVEDFYDEQ